MHAFYFRHRGNSDENNVESIDGFIREFTDGFREAKTIDNYVLNTHVRPGYSHCHVVHWCRSSDGSKCQCIFGRGKRLVDWFKKYKYVRDVGPNDVRQMFAYLQKDERRIVEVRLPEHTLFSVPDTEDDVENLQREHEKSQCGVRHRHTVTGGSDAYIGVQCDEGARKRDHETSANARGPAKQTSSEQLGAIFAEKIALLKPTNRSNIVNSKWLKAEHPWWYWRPQKTKDLINVAWNDVVEDWLELPFPDLLDAQWQNPEQFDDSAYYTPYESAEIICRLFIEQSNTIEDAKTMLNDLYKVMAKETPKKNAFYLLSPPSSGKSFVYNSLKKLCWIYGIALNNSKHNGTAFPFNDCTKRYVNEWNECHLEGEPFVEKAKELWEGNMTKVNVKYQSDSDLHRIPLLVSSNRLAWAFCKQHERAFLDRCYKYDWQPQPWLKNLDKQLHPLAWYVLFVQKADNNIWWQTIPSAKELVEQLNINQ